MTQQINRGDQLRLHYSLSLMNGTVADSTFDAEPLCFRFGDGTLPDFLEILLLGMSQGDEKRVEVSPECGWGNPNPEMLQQLPLSDFPAELQPEVGQIIAFSLPSGDELPGAVLAINGDTVEVDFNHPLAGHRVEVRLKIVEHIPATTG